MFLVLVLSAAVLVIVPVPPVVLLLVHAVGPGLFPRLPNAFSHAREHRNDAHKQPLALGAAACRDRFARGENVEDRRTLEGRAPRDLEEPTAIGTRTLPVAFGDVLRDGLRGPQQLVPGVSIGPGQPLAETEGPSHKPDRDTVHIELLVVEHHRPASITSTSTVLPRLQDN